MNIAIILAGGKGSRFGKDKITENLNGKPIFMWSIETFLSHQDVDGVIIVANTKNKEAFREIKKHPQVLTIVPGGETRFKSAYIGFCQAQKQGATTLIFHNGANPGVTEQEITRVIQSANTYGAAGVGRKITSTLRKKNQGTVCREDLFEMETPQAIQTKVFQEGIKNLNIQQSSYTGEVPTDDLCIAERAGVHPQIEAASWKNRKITHPQDLQYMKKILTPDQYLRIGIGQDSHRFSDSGTLILGGVSIPKSPKLKGNSDGDAVLHALTNAISSALGEGSLSLFSDKMCKNGIINSGEYLKKILSHSSLKNGYIHNISIAIEAGKPKLEKYFSKMKKTIAQLCTIHPSQVGITVTSGEKLTAIGQGKGIGVFATVTLTCT